MSVGGVWASASASRRCTAARLRRDQIRWQAYMSLTAAHTGVVAEGLA